MNGKIKLFCTSGLLLLIFIAAIEFILLKTCNNGLYCVGLNAILIMPGIIIADFVSKSPNPFINLGANIIFYFILGGLISLLANKFKK